MPDIFLIYDVIFIIRNCEKYLKVNFTEKMRLIFGNDNK